MTRNLILPLLFACLTAGASCYNPPEASKSRSPAPPAASATADATPTASAPTETPASAERAPNLLEARAAVDAGDFSKGKEIATKIVAAFPDNAAAQFVLGRAHAGLRETDAAIGAYKKATALDAKNAEPPFELASLLYANGRKDESVEYFERAAKIDANSAKKLMAFGEALRTTGKLDRAIVQFGRVIGFEPENANAYYALGLTYVGLDNKIAAGQQLRKLEALNKPLADKLKAEIEKGGR